jgi:hypothetical protein
MNGRMTASSDAIHAFACDCEDDIHWLRPRSAPEFATDNVRARETFRQMTASLGLGALLTLGSAGTAMGPALASSAEALEVVAEGQVAAGLETLPAASAIPTPSLEAAELPLIVTAAASPASAMNAVPDSAPSSAVAGPAPVPTEVAAQQADDARSANDPQELLQFDDMRVPRWIVETILKAADVTGVDPVYMMALADKESSFVPANKASTSSAEGLFQFISSTWLEVVRSFGAKHGLAAEAAAITRSGGQLTIQDEATREHVLGLRRDPYLSALMAAEMMKRDRAKVEKRLGRSISRSEFYLAHFFGVDSASKFMELLDGKPKQSAPRVFPKAAKANKTLFFAKKGRKTRQLTVAEVYSKIDGMIDKRLDRYQGVMTAVSDSGF